MKRALNQREVRAASVGKNCLTGNGKVEKLDMDKEGKAFLKICAKHKQYLICATKRVFPAGSQLALCFEE